MFSSILRAIRNVNRRINPAFRIPSDRDLSDVVALFYSEKLSSDGGEPQMLVSTAANTAFIHVRDKMQLSDAELIRIIGILNARGIIEADILHEGNLVICSKVKLGFTALSFVQEVSSNRRKFWLNSVLIPLAIAFFTALLTVFLSFEQPTNQDPKQHPDHGGYGIHSAVATPGEAPPFVPVPGICNR